MGFQERLLSTSTLSVPYRRSFGVFGIDGWTAGRRKWLVPSPNLLPRPVQGKETGGCLAPVAGCNLTHRARETALRPHVRRRLMGSAPAEVFSNKVFTS